MTKRNKNKKQYQRKLPYRDVVMKFILQLRLARPKTKILLGKIPCEKFLLLNVLLPHPILTTGQNVYPAGGKLLLLLLFFLKYYYSYRSLKIILSFMSPPRFTETFTKKPPFLPTAELCLLDA